MPFYGQWWLGRQCRHLCFWDYHWDSRGLLLSWELHINHWELWSRSQCANRQSSWHFLKTRQIMEDQENQFVSKNKALWSTSPLHVAQQCRAVASISHTNEKKLDAAHHRWQRSILRISWKGKVNKWESHRGNCTSKAGRHYQMQTSEMAWTFFTNGSP